MIRRKTIRRKTIISGLLTRLVLGLVLILAAGLPAVAQVGVPDAEPAPAVPADFHLRAETGSVAPTHSLRILDIQADGTTDFCRVGSENRATGACSETATFSLTAREVARIYTKVTEGDFFGLDASHVGNVVDGSFAEVTITAGGRSSTVLAQNFPLPPFDDIVREINAVVPPQYVLYYNAISDDQ